MAITYTNSNAGISVSTTTISVTASPLTKDEREAIAAAAAPTSNNPFLTGTSLTAGSGSNPTTLSANGTGGNSTVDLTDTTGYVSGVYIDILLDDGTLHTTTQNGAPSGSTITLTDALPSSGTVATSGNYVSIPDLETVESRGGRDALSIRLNEMESIGASWRLAAAISASATSTTLRVAPQSVTDDKVWVAIDPFTTECEIRRASFSGTTVNWSGGLAYSHSADDAVLPLPNATAHVALFGAVGDGSTDDQAALEAAIVQAKGQGLPLEFAPGLNYLTTDTLFLGREKTADNYVEEVIGHGARITGQTSGEPLVDCVGVSYIRMHNLEIIGSATNPPGTGLLLGRNDNDGGTVASTARGLFTAVRVEGIFEEAALASIDAETNTFIQCWFRVEDGSNARVAALLASSNYEGITPTTGAGYSFGFSTNTIAQFIGCYFHHLDTSPPANYATLEVADMQGASFFGCIFHDAAETGALVRLVKADGTGANVGGANERISFRDCTFHDGYKHAIWIGMDSANANSAYSLRNLIVEGCRWKENAGITATGAHDGGNNEAALTDSGEAWAVDEWIGRTITNDTDGSSGVITANTATTITATLSGGTDDDWDTGDTYTILAAADVYALPDGTARIDLYSPKIDAPVINLSAKNASREVNVYGDARLSIGNASWAGLLSANDSSTIEGEVIARSTDTIALPTTHDALVRYTNQPANTIAAEAALGTTGTATLTGARSDWLGGEIILTPGGTGITTGKQATVSYPVTYNRVPIVIISPAGTNAADLTTPLYATTFTTTGFEIYCSTALATGTAHKLTYRVEVRG